jgi:heme exporter protein CcmD
MNDFWSMGGYGGYVWSAYGLAVLVIGWNVVAAHRYWRRGEELARRRLAAGREMRP